MTSSSHSYSIIFAFQKLSRTSGLSLIFPQTEPLLRGAAILDVKQRERNRSVLPRRNARNPPLPLGRWCRVGTRG